MLYSAHRRDSFEVKFLRWSSWTSWVELWIVPPLCHGKSKSIEILSLSIFPLCPYLQRHSTCLKAVQYLCLLTRTHLSRCCSQDLFAVLREIWVLKGYCWHLYSICQLPLLNALSNLASNIIFNPKTLGLDLIEVAIMSNSGSLEKLHACGDISAKSYYAVKCPVSGTKSAFNFIWNSLTWIWHCFITLDVRIMVH